VASDEVHRDRPPLPEKSSQRGGAYLVGCGADFEMQRVQKLRGRRRGRQPVLFDARIEPAHRARIDASRQQCERLADDGEAFQSLRSNQRGGFVWRKEGAVILERDKIRLSQFTVGGIAIRDVDRAVGQCAVGEIVLHANRLSFGERIDTPESG
jgi:hypothetical protein